MWKDIEMAASELNSVMNAITRDIITVGEDQIFHGTIMSREDQMDVLVNLKAAHQLLVRANDTIQSYRNGDISSR